MFWQRVDNQRKPVSSLAGEYVYYANPDNEQAFEQPSNWRSGFVSNRNGREPQQVTVNCD